MTPGGNGRPALVLSGGGARAAYQVGVLRHIARRRPESRFPVLTGVSAGAINIAYLASHTGSIRDATESLARHWRSLTTRNIFRSDPVSVARTAARWLWTLGSAGSRLGPSARSLVDTGPLRQFLRRVLDPPGIAENIAEGRLRAAAITATSYQTGRTVTFVQGGPDVKLWERPQRRAVHDHLTVDHVMASSALPVLFPAERVGEEYYGDGSIRQAAPLAPAVHLGADRILALSARYDRSVEEAATPAVEGYPPPAQVLGTLFNNIFLDALDADAARLQRINRILESCDRWARDVDDLHPVDLMVLRPSRDLGALAVDHREELPRTVRFLLSGLGSREGRESDFTSYLLFEPRYLARLIELGEHDAEENWDRIAEFMGWERVEAGARGTAGGADGG